MAIPNCFLFKHSDASYSPDVIDSSYTCHFLTHRKFSKLVFVPLDMSTGLEPLGVGKTERNMIFDNYNSGRHRTILRHQMSIMESVCLVTLSVYILQQFHRYVAFEIKLLTVVQGVSDFAPYILFAQTVL